MTPLPSVPLGTEIVPVIVGSEKQSFNIHKALLCASSKLCASAFNGPSAEAQSHKMTSPELDPKLFAFFYRWLYTPPRKGWDPLYQRPQDLESPPDVILLKLYLMSDYLMAPGFQLLTIEQLKQVFSSSEATIPSHEFINLLFKDDQLYFVQAYLVKHIGF